MNEPIPSPTEPRPIPPGLYIVGTPIGNLADLSPRARAVLAGVSLVAAEDTRTTANLFRDAPRRPRFVSLTEHNVSERIPALLAMAADGAVALVSDAGTPGIADPGARLVEAAHAAGIPVIAVPGPSALAAAISASGFDGSDVHFLGFLPRAAGERRSRLQSAATGARTLVFFESPGRLARTLDELAESLDDPEVVVCRELTKVHEEIRRGRASVLAAEFAGGTRGECTVVVRSPEREPGIETARRLVAAMRRAGARRTAAAAEVARETGLARAEVYGMWDEGAGGGP